MNEGAKDWIAIGRIGRPKGLRGEVRLEVFNPMSRLLEDVASVMIGSDPATGEQGTVISVSRQSHGLVARFAGIDSREDAQKMTGSFVYVERDALPKLPEGEFYCADLVGFRVLKVSGEELGVLKEIMPTASNDIYVIKTNEEEVLIPVIDGVVKRIDVKAGEIIVDPPEEIDAF